MRCALGDRIVTAASGNYELRIHDTDGTLWVRRTGPTDGNAEWHVYDADGILTATIDLPGRLRPMEITNSEIRGVWQDEMDVEYIVRYGYRRAST